MMSQNDRRNALLLTSRGTFLLVLTVARGVCVER